MAKSQNITVDALWQLQRISGLALAPNGQDALISVTTPSLPDNRSCTQLWLLNTAGGKPRALTTCGDKDGQGAWSPQGERIAFVAKREQGGEADKTPQLYVMPSNGGEAKRVSHFAHGIEAFRWMPDGKHVIFIAWTWPDVKGAAAQNKAYQAFVERKESGYVTSDGQYRHFDRNLPQGRVSQLWRLNLVTGRANNLLEGTAYELPRDEPGLAHFDISPDGRHIVFCADLATPKMAGQPLSLVELDLRSGRFTSLASEPRWDFTGPRYRPDGQQIATVASEVGRHHMALGQLTFITRGKPWSGQAVPWALDVNTPLRWTTDGRRVLFSAEERGRCHAWAYEPEGKHVTKIVEGGWVQALDVAGDTLVTLADSAMHPAQVRAHDVHGTRRIEHFNDALLKRLKLGELREVSVTGALGDPVQMWLVLPPKFNPTKQYPVLHVIHGGPYSAFGDSFSYRWNAHLMAAQGYVVAQVNFHGSSGFGFEFRASITGRLGQLETQDIQAGTDWLLAQPWVDASRVFAGGGSYGGYMVAWLNGQWPAWPQGPIRAYVCHAGVFDRVATWSADSYTQRHRDLGATYWANPAKVQAQSPVAFAAQMNTPTLVMHGAQDFRVPDHNGLAYYNTLKARGVDARLVWFADENHWVLKPRNSTQWYSEFFAWLKRHGGKGATHRAA